MKPNYENEKVCPCCGRHCPIDSLSCPRGREHFAQSTSADSGDHQHHRHGAVTISDETVKLLMQCGHTLHHGLIGRAANEDILSFLTQNERDELNVILKKCLDNWN